MALAGFCLKGSPLMLVLLVAALVSPLPVVCDQDVVWKKDIKVRYYSTIVLNCHHDNNNSTTTNNNAQTSPEEPPPRLVFWITPDASLLSNTTPRGDFPENVLPVLHQDRGFLEALNITEVNDQAFGYYTCVMVLPSSSPSSGGEERVRVTRWGLNVDGADFSELEKEYRKNAIIGAIAASAMILLLGGACLIWHFRYSRRHPLLDQRNKGFEDKNDVVKKEKKKVMNSSEEGSHHNHHRSNPAFEDSTGLAGKTPEAEVAAREGSGSGYTEGGNSDVTKEEGLVGSGDPVVCRM